jgi:hypothetical protein
LQKGLKVRQLKQSVSWLGLHLPTLLYGLGVYQIQLVGQLAQVLACLLHHVASAIEYCLLAL